MCWAGWAPFFCLLMNGPSTCTPRLVAPSAPPPLKTLTIRTVPPYQNLANINMNGPSTGTPRLVSPWGPPDTPPLKTLNNMTCTPRLVDPCPPHHPCKHKHEQSPSFSFYNVLFQNLKKCNFLWSFLIPHNQPYRPHLPTKNYQSSFLWLWLRCQ